jgi:hypothetical protein
MPLARWQPERPCPIPGHPQDDTGDGPHPVSGSAWQRMQAWHLHAPAERLPLPAVLLTWPAAWILHWLQVPVRAVAWTGGAVTVITWLAWAWRHRRARKIREASPDRPETGLRGLFLPTEAALMAAAWGGWVTAAVAFGPTARPDRWPTLVYLAGAVGGYWWLRRHDAVRAARRRRDEAAAELTDRKLWHQILARAGLGGWHVQWRRDTNLGEERLITTSPENGQASRIAANSRAIAEKLEHILDLPYNRVDITTTDYPGELIIGIRTVDVSVRAAAYHPMTIPWPDAQPSPFADWFPQTASIRDPVIWGFCPEDGSALTMELFSEIGGQAVGVIGMTGSGKSNLLNGAREKVTRCDDARLVQLNGAHMGDELTWEPLSTLTLCGPVATDEELRNKMAAALEALCLLVTNRSATLAETGHSTFQPTPDHPAVEIIIDEVDEIVKHVPGAGQALEFLASKQRKSAVGLVLATQRAVIAALGGGAVRANMSEVLVGKVARATESRHATGAEKEIPDIREYAKGAPGYFQRWDPHSGQVTGRGRAFLLGKPPVELAYMKRLVDARRDLRDWSIPDMPPLALDGGQATAPTPAPHPPPPGSSDLRERLARARELNKGRPRPVRPGAVPVVPGVPPDAMPVLMRLLASPDGTSATEAGMALVKSKQSALNYLTALRERGIAIQAGAGRGHRWHVADAEPPATPEAIPAPATAVEPEPRPYLTLENLAEFVLKGLAEADDEQRAVLEQAHDLIRRQRLRLVEDDRDDTP